MQTVQVIFITCIALLGGFFLQFFIKVQIEQK